MLSRDYSLQIDRTLSMNRNVYEFDFLQNIVSSILQNTIILYENDHKQYCE